MIVKINLKEKIEYEIKKFIGVTLIITMFSTIPVYAIKPAINHQLELVKESLVKNSESKDHKSSDDIHLRLLKLVYENLENKHVLNHIYYFLFPCNLMMGIYVAPYEHWAWDLCNIVRWLYEDGIRDKELGRDGNNDALRHKWQRICYEFQEWIKRTNERPSKEFVDIFMKILYEIYKKSSSMCPSKPLNYSCIREICEILQSRCGISYNLPEIEDCSRKCACVIM